MKNLGVLFRPLSHDVFPTLAMCILPLLRLAVDVEADGVLVHLDVISFFFCSICSSKCSEVLLMLIVDVVRYL